ncbi:unnamed protein product [Cuscuta epithymum]|uniref:Ubiquitin-like protease family profile domain-containing protein n=1 Tax=Cuscuta epithymum TaxID=186058 RepID=A0AAV0F0L1_9ASTE|nr:unnamed protein product [Cuscuta epithymum]
MVRTPLATMAERALELQIPLSKHFPAQYSMCSDVKHVSKYVKDMLSKQQMAQFRKTPWGHFADIPDIQFCAQIVHMLLLRMVKQQPKDELWFNIVGKIEEFTYNDFCRITGLPPAAPRPAVAEDTEKDDEDAEDEEEPEEISKTYFGGSLDITFQMMKDKVDEVRGGKKRKGDLPVKLASLFVVENVLLGKDRTTRISRKSIQLVNDFEEFKKEPWSRDAYDLLVTHVKRLLDGHPMKFVDSKTNNPEYKNAKFSIYGFILVLQVWAYERIPKFGEHFGTRVGNDEVPILNWTCHGKFRSSKIRKLVFADEVPTPPNSDDEDEGEHDNIELETKEKVEEMCSNIDEIKISVQRLEKKVDEELGELKNLLVKVIDTVNKALQEKGNPYGPSQHGEETEVCTTPVEVQRMSTHGVENAGTAVGDDFALTPHAPLANLDWDLGDEVATGGVDMMALEEASMKEVRKRKRLPSKYICSPFIAPAAKRPKVGGTITRAQLQQSDEECQSFKAWVEEDDEVEPCVIEIAIPSSYPTNRAFFRELIDETGWLSSQHLDALVLMFRECIHDEAYELLSPLFAYQLLRKNVADDSQWSGDRFLNKMDWSRYEKVFMPLHSDGKHWVLSEIDLVNRIVRVYDSMKTRRLVGCVRLLCVRLPHLFRVIKCNPALSATADSQTWRAEAVDDVPQQQPGSGVCGVMVMAFAEALLQKLPLLPGCAYDNMALKRCEFAMRLWSLRKRSS